MTDDSHNAPKIPAKTASERLFTLVDNTLSIAAGGTTLLTGIDWVKAEESPLAKAALPFLITAMALTAAAWGVNRFAYWLDHTPPLKNQIKHLMSQSLDAPH